MSKSSMTYKTVTSYQEEAPSAIDKVSAPGKVYLRRNIIETTDSEGNPCYQYEELLLTEEQYLEYTSNPMIEILMQTLTDIQATLDEMA